MKKLKIYIIDVILLIFLIILDQITKFWAVMKLKDRPAVKLIDGVFEFNYLENKGAAFGMFQNQKLLFVLITIIFLAVIAFVVIKMPADSKYTKLHILLMAVGGGAIGNLIDRLRFDYVVDFMYFSIINFPIFNVADVCITVSTFTIVILILFVYKDHDFYFLGFKPQKFRELK